MSAYPTAFPTAVEDLTCRRDAIITVVRLRVIRDLQKDLGKEGGRSNLLYRQNSGSDRDKDGIACEKA